MAWTMTMAREENDGQRVRPGAVGSRGRVQIGVTIANDVFPEAIEYFLGHAGGEDVDSEDEEDDDDEDEEEIDLEKPRPKKQKKA